MDKQVNSVYMNVQEPGHNTTRNTNLQLGYKTGEQLQHDMKVNYTDIIHISYKGTRAPKE